MIATNPGRALVLGPGGPVGTAWLLGLAAGLHRHGVDLAAADLIVGTSAGAIAGAMIASGRDLDAWADTPSPARPPAAGGGAGPVMARVFGLLNDAALDPAEARRRVGRLALEADALDGEAHRERIRALVGTDDWPDGQLLVTGVDVASGEPVVWDRTSGVPLSAAVAASSAAPGMARPVTIGGRRYMDGAFGGGSNAALAAGAGTVVLVEPVGFGGPGAGADVRLVPDAGSLRAFGGDLGDTGRWGGCFRAGVRQSAGEAARLRPGPWG
ncbi:patatin-like phospholipase family protein [Spirillospora sp. NPDC052242]